MTPNFSRPATGLPAVPDGFERYPRRPLRLRLDRRQVLLFIWTSVKVAFEQGRGGAARKLPELGVLDDELLELLRPAVSADCTIGERDGVVCGQLKRERRTIALFASSSPARVVLQCMNGDTSLGAIAARVGDSLTWDATTAFAYSRGVFLHLVTLGVVVLK